MAQEKLIVALSADIKDLKQELAKANQLLDNFASGVDDNARKGGNAFSGLTTSVKGLVGAYLSLSAAQQVLATSFNNSLKLDALQGAFAVIFDGAEEGERQLERLRGKSEELGLEFSSLANAYKLFAGATTQSGMSIAETNRIFDSVAKTSALLKLSAEDTEGALRALAQMMGKGTVSSEELKQQFGERIPGAFKLAANAMGVTEQEMIKMLEQGQIMATDLLPKLANELDKAFGDKVQGNIQGMSAEWNRFKNNIFNSTSGFSKFFGIIIKGFNDVFTQLGNDIQRIFMPEQFQADKAFKSLNNAIEKTNSENGLKGLIQNFETIRMDLVKGSAMWNAYTKAISQASGKIKDMNTIMSSGGKAKFTGGNGSSMAAMVGTQEQIKTAQELFALYQKFPNVLSSLGQEYASNPFFRDLINGELKASVQGLKGEMDNLRMSSNMTFTDPAMEAYIANMQNVVNLVGGALAQSFESALTSGQDFFKVLGQALKALIARLIAAVVAAVALTAIIGIFTGGAGLAAIGGFGGIFKGLSGFTLPNADRAVSPVLSGGMGRIEWGMRGDMLYGVLQNYQQRLDRLQ